MAQIVKTAAQASDAGKPKEAEAVERETISALEKSGQPSLLAAALIAHGITLARLRHTEMAEATLERAIAVALQAGALDKAGLAALTMIEELEQLSPAGLMAAYERASTWLADSRCSLELLRRVTHAARKVLVSLRGEIDPDKALEILLAKPRSWHEQMLEHERKLIKQALAKTNGSI